MIVLLTGKPGVGKSTVIEKFIRLNTLPSSWVITKAILRPETNLRVGFQAINSDGVERVISHKKNIESSSFIGENRVDIEAVNVMFADTLANAQESKEELTIIDEIGPIQLLSEVFDNSLTQVFSSQVNMVASIHYSDERLSGYRESPNNLLLEVSDSNRNALPDALVAVTRNFTVINALDKTQRQAFNDLLKHYISQASSFQIHKLTSNAVHYVAEGNVEQIDNNHWQVKGKHDLHDVSRNNEVFECDCDLFNGRNRYTNQAGECSHIQAVIISSIQ